MKEKKRCRYSLMYRVITFTPLNGLRKILRGVMRVVPLQYGGEYDSVAWWSAPGIEQFRPLDGAKPTLGRVGKLTKGKSVRLEFSIPRDKVLLKKVIEEGIFPYHPWKEPVVIICAVRETRVIKVKKTAICE